MLWLIIFQMNFCVTTGNPTFFSFRYTCIKSCTCTKYFHSLVLKACSDLRPAVLKRSAFVCFLYLQLKMILFNGAYMLIVIIIVGSPLFHRCKLIPVGRACPLSGRISSRVKRRLYTLYSMYNIINHTYTTTTAVHFHVPRSSPQDPRSQIQVPKLSHAASHAARRSAPTPPDAHATHCLSSTRPPRRRSGTNLYVHYSCCVYVLVCLSVVLLCCWVSSRTWSRHHREQWRLRCSSLLRQTVSLDS